MLGNQIEKFETVMFRDQGEQQGTRTFVEARFGARQLSWDGKGNYCLFINFIIKESDRPATPRHFRR